ncbi:MAG TPA: DUF1330 domain-containing protein [Alphaproteobacteria bacterium]|nr:DUF1330 domain-containing protein [Alphaproteobacteria bacterium]
MADAAPAPAPAPAPVPAYAVARLRDVAMGPEIADYLRRIDATLEPFGGRFLVHGGPVDRLEGGWEGETVVIAFPDAAAAHAWYGSPAYREILPLRLRNAECEAAIVQGVAAGYRAADLLEG